MVTGQHLTQIFSNRARRIFLSAALALIALPLSAEDLSPHIASVQQWDETMAQLEKRFAHMRDVSEAMGPDMAGHGAREYADRWLLTSEDRGALAALGDRAGDLQRSGNSALREILKAATPLLGIQIFRFEVPARYWRLQETLKIHRTLLQPLLEKSSQSERSQTTAHLQTALDRVPDLYFSAMTIADVESMKREGSRINAIAAYPIGVYNDERQRLAALFAPADLLNDSTTLRWENHAPCDRRSTQTSGQRAPSERRDSRNSAQTPHFILQRAGLQAWRARSS